MIRCLNFFLFVFHPSLSCFFCFFTWSLTHSTTFCECSPHYSAVTKKMIIELMMSWSYHCSNRCCSAGYSGIVGKLPNTQVCIHWEYRPWLQCPQSLAMWAFHVLPFLIWQQFDAPTSLVWQRQWPYLHEACFVKID